MKKFLLLLTLSFVSCAVNHQPKFYYEYPKIPLTDWEISANKLLSEKEITLNFVGKSEDNVVLKSDGKVINMEVENLTPNNSNIFFYQFEKPEKEISFSVNGKEVIIPKEEFQNYLHIYVEKYSDRFLVYLTHRPGFDGAQNFNYSKKIK